MELTETGLIVALWTVLSVGGPQVSLSTVYLPGYLAGLLLCPICMGYFEHARGMTTSHYGRLYNVLFLQ